MEKEDDRSNNGGVEYDFTPTPDNPLYKVSEVAKMLGVKPWSVRQWIKEDKIKATQINKQWRIPRAEVSRIANEKWG
jgi:excisionase family DNA binding protein